MFSNMKNKIREKTGSELPKFVPQQKGLGRHSRQGSETSLSSIGLDPPLVPSTVATLPVSQQDSVELKVADGKISQNLNAKEQNRLTKREEEWRNRFEKREAEWTKKLEKRETELANVMQEKEKEWRRQEQILTEDLLNQTRELKEALRTAEECKKNICQYQEDKDQLEGFQNQEIAKIKHLLLAKEKDSADNAAAFKESLALVESLKTEVNRLRPFEEQISNFQDDLECLRHSSERERWQLTSRLAQSEETVRHLTDRVVVLTRRSEAECVALGANLSQDERVQALLGERALLERRLEEAHVHLSDIKASWSGQISSLETQVGRLSRQAGEEGSERRRVEARMAELEQRLDEGEKERGKLSARLESVSAERDALESELKTVSQDLVLSKDKETDLSMRLSTAESQYEDAKTECSTISTALADERETSAALREQLASADEGLKQERERLRVEVDRADREKREKDEALLRNAQVSQQVELIRQELSMSHQETEELYKKLLATETSLSETTKELASNQTELSQLRNVKHDVDCANKTEQQLKLSISELEDQLSERNKTIRMLQQRLNDMKKTLQRELKGAADPGGGSSVEVLLNNSAHQPAPVTQASLHDDDVNFKYLKHVLIKYLTCREYEAQHLTCAVSTLLRLTAEEEQLLRETQDWRTSWFGSRSRIGKSKASPHS